MSSSNENGTTTRNCTMADLGDSWEADPLYIEFHHANMDIEDDYSTISGLSGDADMSGLEGFDEIVVPPVLQPNSSTEVAHYNLTNASDRLTASNSGVHDNGTSQDASVSLQILSDLTLCDDFASREQPSSSLLSSLADDLLCQVGSYLNVSALKSIRFVNRRFRALFSLNEAGWTQHCHALWQRKVHVTPLAQEILTQPQPTSALEAYKLSCIDAQSRQEITPGELCYDPEHPSTVWSFRFKECAGPEWTSFDPWHGGREARKMVFLHNGTVRQLVTVVNQGGLKTQELRLPFFDNTDSNGLEITWSLVKKPIDLPMRPEGAYIRLNVGGRDVPTYVVQRSPSLNWGFLLENCWGVFASFSLPPKHSAARRGAMSFVAAQLPRNRNRDLGGEHEESPSKRQRTENSDVLSDSSLAITNNWQWREALLYNLGATTLPDGDGGADFERAWRVDREGGIPSRNQMMEDSCYTYPH